MTTTKKKNNNQSACREYGLRHAHKAVGVRLRVIRKELGLGLGLRLVTVGVGVRVRVRDRVRDRVRVRGEEGIHTQTQRAKQVECAHREGFS